MKSKQRRQLLKKEKKAAKKVLQNQLKDNCEASNSLYCKRMIPSFTNNSKTDDHRRYLLRLHPNVPAIFLTEFILVREKVGEGSFGDVYNCLVPSLGAMPIIAKILKDTENLDFEVERNMLQAVSGHPNFPFCYGYSRNPNTLLMQSFQSSETIYQILKSGKVNMQWKCLVLQIVNGLLHLHDKLLVLHNDVKTDNVIVQNGERAIIIDLGKATPIARPRTYNLNATEQKKYNHYHRHLAYELRNTPNSTQSHLTDAYSFGYLLKKIGHSSLVEVVPQLLEKHPKDRLSLKSAREKLK